MAVWIAAAVMLSVYFCALPVYIVLFVRIRDSLRIGTGVSVWIPSLAVRAAQKRAADKNVRGAAHRRPLPPEKAGGFHLAAFPAAWKLYRALAKHIRFEDFSVTGRICAADAARTALLCGIMNAADSSFCACTDALRLRVIPDFSAGGSDLRAVGMISIRIGHIMTAPISHMKELKNLWKSTRSKAS